MQVKKKLFYYWETIQFITEKTLIDEQGNVCTVSVTQGGTGAELMIFLGKEKYPNADYEVRIYKNNPWNRYIPHKSDCVKSYEENAEYATFYFNNFETARDFVANLLYCHKEYQERPVGKV